MTNTPAAFRFSLWRMLLMMALVGLWLGGLRVLSVPWIVWLSTAVFYLGVLLCFPGDEARQ